MGMASLHGAVDLWPLLEGCYGRVFGAGSWYLMGMSGPFKTWGRDRVGPARCLSKQPTRPAATPATPKREGKSNHCCLKCHHFWLLAQRNANSWMLALLATGALSKNQAGGMSRQKGRQGHQAIDCIYRGEAWGMFYTPHNPCACRVHLEASVETYVKMWSVLQHGSELPSHEPTLAAADWLQVSFAYSRLDTSLTIFLIGWEDAVETKF